MSYQSYYQPYHIHIQDTDVTVIDATSNTQTQPSSISLPLFSHQKSILTRMQELESSNRIFTSIGDDVGDIIDTNFGVLADKVGSGKTLSAVALMSQNEPPKKGYQFLSGHRYASLVRKMPSDNQINLILVPHSLVNQWKDCFQYSNCILETVKRESHIIQSITSLKKAITENPERGKVLLVNANFALKVQNESYKQGIFSPFLCWRRIIIDEAHQIKLNTSIKLRSHFIWLITATPRSLRYASSQIIRLNIGNYLSDSFLKIIIKNSNSYIDASIQLPDMVKHNYICHTPSEYILLQNELGDDVMSLLHSGNVEEALVKLNCNVDTKENIYSLVTKKLQNKLHNAEKHLQYLKSIHPDNPEVNNKNIQTAEEGILSISTRCNTIHKNIYQMNDSLCPICYSEFNTPTLTPCCCNTFCLQCIIKSLQMNSNQCPFCRDTIDTSKLNSIQDLEAPHKKDTSAKEEVMNKLDKLVEIVTNNDQKKKILIFSCFDLKYIKVKLDELNLKNEEICGTSDHIEKVLKDYRYNRTPILLLSAKHYGSGLNLEMTTDLVIYHRLSNDLQSQVIGRAHRVGRKESLRVHQLLHSNE